MNTYLGTISHDAKQFSLSSHSSNIDGPPYGVFMWMSCHRVTSKLCFAPPLAPILSRLPAAALQLLGWLAPPPGSGIWAANCGTCWCSCLSLAPGIWISLAFIWAQVISSFRVHLLPRTDVVVSQECSRFPLLWHRGEGTSHQACWWLDLPPDVQVGQAQ